ncbi:hypothetical protein [Qipengyuania sp. ASV99]|uniref:hypothetical protein n=1 Tax=Qipengyuania sp. ASV99 TaxID=3399681 RepID=UPI003A4C7763
MVRKLSQYAAAATLVLTPAVMAKADGAGEMAPPAPSKSETSEAQDTATPVRLVSWDGDFEFMKESRRMRIWRSHVAYNLTVDAEGDVTDCELTESFRLKSVSERLCDILSEHHEFEPAQNAEGEPVEGSYSARIAYADVRERLE